jgi:hypothetical protein
VLLVWLPLPSLSLAGKEHGRTIPLADMGDVRLLQCTDTAHQTRCRAAVVLA